MIQILEQKGWGIYKGYSILTLLLRNNKGEKWYQWQVFGEGGMIFQDFRTIDGDREFRGMRDAYEDGCKNVDALFRIAM